MDIALTVTGLSLKKGYNLLISQLNFALKSGDILSLTGENGVGKTTLLRTIAGFSAPFAGEISFVANGSRLDSDTAPQICVHLLGHHDALSPSRTVQQELDFVAGFLGGDAASLSNAIERLRLKPLLDLETRYLSAGQKRRVSCARLLIAPRPLWLLDEPMAPLDADHRAMLAGLMQDHAKAGGAIIAAVHDPLPFPTKTLRLERPTMAQREAMDA